MQSAKTGAAEWRRRIFRELVTEKKGAVRMAQGVIATATPRYVRSLF
jgi:hypothetical protein